MMRWWNDLWEKFYWHLLSLRIKRQLGRAPQVELSTRIGSTWYSVQKERTMNKENLVRICTAVTTDPKFVARDGKTYCNLAFMEVAAEMGCDVFRGMMANQIIDYVSKAKDWRRVTGEEAHEHARRGGLGVASRKGRPHGHVAAVFPGERMLFSGSLNKYVPLVANVGKKNGIMKASEAFPVKEGEPDYYIYGDA